ncbi:hypothetical protein BLA14095_04414 [Burkholderia lata]|nr:hypothetical protein BLA14095_04414 [Burkholderia lata]
MIRNTRDVSGWRQEDSRRLSGASTRVAAGGNRMTQHPDGSVA